MKLTISFRSVFDEDLYWLMTFSLRGGRNRKTSTEMFMKNLFVFLVFIAVVYSQTDDEESFLFVTKQTVNRFIVQDKELTIKYGLYNSGPTTVFNVNLNDVHSYPNDKYELLVGTLSPRWERINAGANLTHVVVLKPKQSGISNSSHAIVTYQKSERNTDVQKTYSSEIGDVYIMTSREYDRRFSSHIIDWILFTAMASPCIVFPFFLWYNSKRKYESLLLKDKTVKKVQ